MSFTRTTSTDLSLVASNMNKVMGSLTAAVSILEHEAVDLFTPVDRGMLHQHLSQDKVTSTEASIGPLGDLKIDEPAPRGTISAFVAWYEDIYGERPAPGHAVPPELAWKLLSPQQKEILYSERKAGNTAFGGPYPPPVYFGAVDQGRVPGYEGMSAGFADDIRNHIKAGIPFIIERYKA